MKLRTKKLTAMKNTVKALNLYFLLFIEKKF